MGSEIERKYLVRDGEWTPQEPGIPMRQGYLSAGGTTTVRVRVEGAAATLTIKGPTVNLSRSEFEYDIPVDDAEEMLRTLGEGVVEKTRHHVVVGDHTWEIDVFEGENAGLVTAEIELDAEDEAFVRPSWLGAEVSHDPRYRNSSLARQPWKAWT